MILFNVYFNPFLAVILRFFHAHQCFPVVLAQCGVSTAGCRQRCLLPLFLPSFSSPSLVVVLRLFWVFLAVDKQHFAAWRCVMERTEIPIQCKQNKGLDEIIEGKCEWLREMSSAYVRLNFKDQFEGLKGCVSFLYSIFIAIFPHLLVVTKSFLTQLMQPLFFFWWRQCTNCPILFNTQLLACFVH